MTSKTKGTQNMANEISSTENQPYDDVIDLHTSVFESYVDRAQKIIAFVTSFERNLRKLVKYVLDNTSTQSQHDFEREILSAAENLKQSGQRDVNIPRELSRMVEILRTLARKKETQSLLLAIRTDFDRYSELQTKVVELRREYNEPDVIETSEYLSLHELFVGEQEIPEDELPKKVKLCLKIVFSLSAGSTTLPDENDRNEVLRETEAVNHEITLSRMKQILENSFENDMMKAEHLAKLWPREVEEAALSEVMEIVHNLKPSLERWVPLRRQTVDRLREMSTELNDHNRNVAISQTVASSFGIAATVLGVIGAALTPVTFGASLGLVIAGAVVGGASALTNVGSSIANYVITKDKQRMFQELSRKERDELYGREDDIDNQQTDGSEEIIRQRALVDRLFKLYRWVQSSAHRQETSQSTNDFTSMDALRITLPVVYFITGASSSALLGSVRIGAAAAEAATMVTSKLLLSVGGALSLIALPVDIVNVVVLANELKGGAKSAVGEEFARMADRFEAEMKHMESLLGLRYSEGFALSRNVMLTMIIIIVTTIMMIIMMTVMTLTI